MKKEKHSLKFVIFLLLILFTHQILCAADLSSDLTLLNGRLGTLKLKLAELATTLVKLKDSLKQKAPSVPHTPLPIHPGVPAPLENRIFEKDGKRIPIEFIEADMKNAFIIHYNSNNPVANHLDPANCHVVNGPFTYYGATSPEYTAQSRDPHDDIGWGCAWRASLNVLNKVKWWLEQQGIVAQGIFNGRNLNMYDIARWMNWEGAKLPHGNANWIEPANNAELYLQFIEDCFTSENQTKITELLDFRGRLYLGSMDRDSKITEMENFQASRSEFAKLRTHFKTSSDASDLTRKQAIERLYAQEFTFVNTAPILEKNFPPFDEAKNPFPVNFDNGTCAQNIYGIHTHGGDVKHLFVGETHIWGGQTPWLRSEWQLINNFFFKSNNIMMFEVFIRSKTISEYTPEEFQKLLESLTMETKIPAKPKPSLSITSIPKYSDEEMKVTIDNLIDQRNLSKAINARAANHITVNKQAELHTCGYHALCNAIHFFNYFRDNPCSYYFPRPNDLDFFTKKFKLWKPLVLQKTTEMVKIKTLFAKKDISTWQTGDLDDIIFDIIREEDNDVKELWESGALIYYPYHKRSILTLDVKTHAPHYELCIKKFHDNDPSILIWILGQDQHYYILCVVKNNKKFYSFICDSENTKTLKDTEIPTIGTISSLLCRSKKSFEQFYTEKISSEITCNKITIETLLRELQSHPELIAYLLSLKSDIKKPITDKLKAKIPELSGTLKPALAYDLIPINRPEQRKARALYVLIDFFENNAEIESRIAVEGVETDAIYYLHYKDKNTATTKKESKDPNDYCFKKKLNPETIAELPSGLEIIAIAAGEPKLKLK